MNLFGISGIILGVTCLVLVLIVSIYGKTRLHRVWVLFNVVVAIWGFGCYFVAKASNASSALTSWKFAYIGIIFISVLFYHTTCIFCNVAEKRRKLIKVAYIQAFFFMLLTNTNLFITKVNVISGSLYYHQSEGLLYILFFSIWLSLVVLGHYELIKFYRKSYGIKKNQSLYFLIGIIFGFSGGSSNFLPVFGLNLHPIGNFTIPIYCLISTYAILRYRLMDLRPVIRKSLIYTLSVSILTGLFVVLVFAMTKYVFETTGMTSFTLTVISTLVIALLFTPLKNRVQVFVDKVFYKATYDYYATVKRVSHDLASTIELRRTYELIVDTIFDALKLKSAYLLSSENDSFETVYSRSSKRRASGIDYPASNSLAEGDPRGDFEKGQHGGKLSEGSEVVGIVRNKGIVIVEELLIGEDQHRAKIVDEELRAYGGQIVIPIFIEDRLMFLLILGEKLSTDSFTNQDLNLLTTLANQASIALKNARLYDELEQRVQERTLDLSRAVEKLHVQINERKRAEEALQAAHSELEMRVQERTAELRDSNVKLMQEMNERERVEADVRKAAYEWRTTFDSMKEIIIVLDNTDKVVKVNRAGSVFFNKTYGDIIGQPVIDLFESIGSSQDMGPLSIVKHSEKYEESEMYFSEKNMWCLVTVAPVLHDKTLMGAVCILTDITQLKKMQDSILEAKNDWEDTFDTINDAITIHDREFNVIRSNRAAETMLGLPLVQIMKHKCFTSYHGTDHPPENCPSCDTLKTGDACSTEIFEERLGKYLEIKALPRYDKQNHVVGLIHVVRDITERKKAEEERKKLEAQLVHAQKMESIGRLAGGIAHDFNNLLSVIIGCSELGLMSLPEDSTLRDQLAMVKEAGDRATALTRQLLAFSRKQILEMKEVNLMDIVDHMGKMLSRLIGEQIAMETKNSGRVSNVKADKVQVEQIIMNLVVNARDSMPNGGRLIIETADILLEGAESHHSESVEPGRYVMLSVTDDGEGMTREVKEKIFEPFFTTKGKGYGTGLGLATVYGIVRQHKGHIAVDSEPGRGTTFKIYFPVSETAMEESLIERPGVTIQRGNETVLVVDDEAFICKMAADALQPLGYTILQAFSGEEALGICDTYEGIINLLLTDVIMPGMNGKQLAEKFLQKRPDTAIVFMSGYTDDVIGVHGVLDPGTIFIQKPITPNSLLLKVRNVLDKREEKLADLALSENFGALHILLVDDDEANRNLVQMFLKNYSFKIDVAESGVKALEKFKSIRYDLVLMDMVMPEMDGYAAVAEIRKWEKQQNMLPTPIIAVTGNDTWEGLEKCLDAGCTSHLAKPIRKENLKKVIAAYAGRNRQSMPDHGTTQRGKMAVVVDIDLKDLVPAYLQSRLRDVETLREALSREEYETIRILGHSMKGSGAIYGFDAITEIGMQIEQSAKENNRTDIDQLLHKLSDYLEHVEVVYG